MRSRAGALLVTAWLVGLGALLGASILAGDAVRTYRDLRRRA